MQERRQTVSRELGFWRQEALQGWEKLVLGGFALFSAATFGYAYAKQADARQAVAEATAFDYAHCGVMAPTLEKAMFYGGWGEPDVIRDYRKTPGGNWCGMTDTVENGTIVRGH
jgi:hypothetical protein